MKMQEIITNELHALGGPLTMLETGSIRSGESQYEDGDGWSTIAFAKYVEEFGGSFISIDRDTTAADEVLRREGLRARVTLWEGDSLVSIPEALATITPPLDVVLLDSDNDATLTLEEFYLVKERMRTGAVLLVDDVVPGSKNVVKGHKILPHLRSLGYEPDIIERDGGNFTSGVLRVVL